MWYLPPEYTMLGSLTATSSKAPAEPLLKHLASTYQVGLEFMAFDPKLKDDRITIKHITVIRTFFKAVFINYPFFT
jgi:hypothetical protein